MKIQKRKSTFNVKFILSTAGEDECVGVKRRERKVAKLLEWEKEYLNLQILKGGGKTSNCLLISLETYLYWWRTKEMKVLYCLRDWEACILVFQDLWIINNRFKHANPSPQSAKTKKWKLKSLLCTIFRHLSKIQMNS